MRWKLKSIEGAAVAKIAAEANLPVPLARVLALRGFHDASKIGEFLAPRLDSLSDPFLLPGMEAAVSRIWKAIDAGEQVVVFGDYDADGVTATALLYRVLRRLGARAEAFIPDRMDEGYGLSRDAQERCIEAHAPALVVTVDCGTNAVESVAFARSRGVDVIVTDHHEPAAEVADGAVAMVNPKLGDFQPLEKLAGVGVAFKLSHALIKSGREQGREAAGKIDLRDYLDLAALGTVADLVPLLDENRILVRNGLVRLGMTRWEGLRALKAVAGIRGEAEAYHLGFQLGPRINAAGRIGEPMKALRLLTTDNPAEAREIAEMLDANNRERRRMEQEMADAAFAEIDAYFDPARHFGLVVAREGWHPGVVGIVASRVARHYGRPAIVMGIDSDGNARGSCRSIDGFDILEGLRSCDSLLEKYGGHQMAAGLELPFDRLDDFKKAFNAVAMEELKGTDLSPVLWIDAEVGLGELDADFLGKLRLLAPFGQDNPEPVWMARAVELADGPRVVGGKHLRFSLRSKGRKIEAIAFNYPLEKFPRGEWLDVAFALKENDWNGTRSLQLQVRDIRAAAG